MSEGEIIKRALEEVRADAARPKRKEAPLSLGESLRLDMMVWSALMSIEREKAND